MTDEWTVTCTDLTSGEMGLAHRGQLIFFLEQEAGPADGYDKMDCQLLDPWLPRGVIITGVCS